MTQIAHLDWSPGDEEPAHLLPDILICRVFYEGRIVFRVVDYRTKYTTCFSADVNFPGRAFKHVVEVFFVLSKALKLASNYLLGRHSRRRQLSLSYVKKEYLSGPFHPCRLNPQTFLIAFSMTIPFIYPHSSNFRTRMVLYSTPMKILTGYCSLPGISDLGSPFISTFYTRVQNFKDSKSSSNPTSVMPLFTS